MKNFIKAFVVLAVVAVCSVALVGCFGRIGGGNRRETISYNIFDGFRAQIPDNAVALGIVESARPTSSSRRTVMASGGNVENVLVGVDDDGEVFEINFIEYDPANPGNPVVLNQRDLPGEIGKLYISADFIFFTIQLWTTPVEHRHPEYNQTDFRSDCCSQAFMICRTTHNVFSLGQHQQFRHISRVQGNTIQVWDWNHMTGVSHNQIFMVSVVNNEAHFELINPNPELQVDRTLTDRYGNIFLLVNGQGDIEQHQNLPNVFAIGNMNHNAQHTLCSQGRLFRHNTRWEDSYLRVFRNGGWHAPDVTAPITVEFHRDHQLLVGSNFVVELWSTNFQISPASITNDRLSINRNHTQWHEASAVIVQDEVLYALRIQDGVLQVMELDLTTLFPSNQGQTGSGSDICTWTGLTNDEAAEWWARWHAAQQVESNRIHNELGGWDRVEEILKPIRVALMQDAIDEFLAEIGGESVLAPLGGVEILMLTSNNREQLQDGWTNQEWTLYHQIMNDWRNIFWEENNNINNSEEFLFQQNMAWNTINNRVNDAMQVWRTNTIAGNDYFRRLHYGQHGNQGGNQDGRWTATAITGLTSLVNYSADSAIGSLQNIFAGTRQYVITIVDGSVVSTLYAERTFDGVVIVLQPLF